MLFFTARRLDCSSVRNVTGSIEGSITVGTKANAASEEAQLFPAPPSAWSSGRGAGSSAATVLPPA